MLTRFHKILIGLLAIQIVLIGVTGLHHDDARPAREQRLLAGFDADKVTRVQLTGKDGKTVDLAKKAGAWVVASAFDYPVDGARASELLSSIAKASAAEPIATQKSRHKQLHVADDELERKVIVTAGGKDLALYIGAPAGARRTAVRIAGDDRVYAVTGLSPYSLAPEARAWVDTSYVKVPKDEVAKLTIEHAGSSVVLEKSGSAWTAAIGGAPVALASGETLDQAAIDKVLDAATSIELSAPADPKRDAAVPTATITIERRPTGAATPAPTVVDLIADGTSYWVHERGSPRAAFVDRGKLDAAVSATRATLIKAPPATQSQSGSGVTAKRAG